MAVTLTRRFHAVGQGLFCSEIVEDKTNGFKHSVVYDCGTESSHGFLQAEMKDLANLLTDRRIDILFLSHLHRDHISGVTQLLQDYDVGKVVLPRISPFQIIRVHVSLFQNDSCFDSSATDLIQRVLQQRETNGEQNIFVEVPMFMVPPTEDAFWLEMGYDQFESDIFSYRNTVRKDYTYPVYSYNGNRIIEYIPFNIEDPQSLLFNCLVRHIDHGSFRNILNGDFSQLEDPAFLRKLVQLYKRCFGNLNESSMPVLSHVLVGNQKRDCLYTGDYTSKIDKNVVQLNSFFSDEWEKIAYMQVPHLGSRNDNPQKLYSDNPLECIVSYGERNRYKHPHDTVVDLIEKKSGNHLIRATENSAVSIALTI